MGLFKNNRRTYITNMDNMLVYNRDTKCFVMDFNSDQRSLLKEFIDKGFPIECIAYTEVPEEVMREARIAFCTNPKLAPIGIWKIVHTNLSSDIQRMLIYAYSHGVSMIDEIKDINTYSENTLELVAYEASKNINVCSLLTKGMSQKQFVSRVQSVYGEESVPAYFY